MDDIFIKTLIGEHFLTDPYFMLFQKSLPADVVTCNGTTTTLKRIYVKRKNK